MIGRLKDLTIDRDGKRNITVSVSVDFGDEFDRLRDKDVEITIKQYREKRSNDANAYFHVLVGKIAEVTGQPFDDIKRDLVLNYGTLMRDEDGEVIGGKLSASADPFEVYKYPKYYQEQYENGKLFKHYLLMEETHTYDTAQMSRLIEGAVYEAKDLGIETRTPEELSLLVSRWEAQG